MTRVKTEGSRTRRMEKVRERVELYNEEERSNWEVFEGYESLCDVCKLRVVPANVDTTCKICVDKRFRENMCR